MTIRNILKKIVKYRQFKTEMKQRIYNFKTWFVSIDEHTLYATSSLIGFVAAALLIRLFL